MHERTRVPFLYQNHDFSVKLMEWIGDVFYDKLKQGCGRLIRTKLDHGAIVIMEPCFMAPWESYVLGALPPNAVIKTIEEFFEICWRRIQGNGCRNRSYSSSDSTFKRRGILDVNVWHYQRKHPLDYVSYYNEAHKNIVR